MSNAVPIRPRGAALPVLAFLVAAFLASVLLPAGTADARTVVVGEDLSRPYARWANGPRFNEMPAPRERVRVEEVAEGCSTCTWLREPAVVRIRVPGHGVRRSWMHELGHRFDFAELSGADRAAFLRIMGDRVPGGEPVGIFDPAWLNRSRGHHSPHEVFADAYKACAGSRMVGFWRKAPRQRIIRWSFLAPPGFREAEVLRTCDLLLARGAR